MPKTKPKKRPAINSRIRSALRRLWLQSEARHESLGRARVQRGIYLCELCGAKTIAANIEVDHKEPATPVSGFDSWDSFINRLFCPPEGLQVICSGCHDAETAKQRKARSEAKRIAKEAMCKK